MTKMEKLLIGGKVLVRLTIKLDNGALLFVLYDFIWYKNNLYY